MDITKQTYEREEVVEKYYDRYLTAPEYFEIDIPKLVKTFPGKKLLDVGCGPGQFSRIFGENGFDVVGIDYSKAMVKKAKSLSSDENNPSYRVMDMKEVKKYFKENTFDVIWASASLLHLEKTEIPIVLKSFKYILRPRGHMYLVIKLGEQGTVLLKDGDLGEGVVRKFTFLNEKWFENLLDGMNFSIIEKRLKKGSVIGGRPSNWGHYWVKSQ
ncbi:class I SAM-dependent methyltransferase [Candidatus Dojkabacteria bacterium]|uniref:Class I SAM-dependent methyltransferase n=1 Tax=Candidatus Dojkabacteria bacterium TaxID=2099670 RepID=A0A955IAR5_9BACT|nr:class I SAM-dependent methyltransferase [Candidatus Dojkabacteria bacterium]